jgi:hypothetical protein
LLTEQPTLVPVTLDAKSLVFHVPALESHQRLFLVVIGKIVVAILVAYAIGLTGRPS